MYSTTGAAGVDADPPPVLKSNATFTAQLSSLLLLHLAKRGRTAMKAF